MNDSRQILAGTGRGAMRSVVAEWARTRPASPAVHSTASRSPVPFRGGVAR